MTTDASSQVTSRSAVLTLYALSDPSVEQHVRRGEPLVLVGHRPNGFVELEYGGRGWLGDEAAVEPWTGREAQPMSVQNGAVFFPAPIGAKSSQSYAGLAVPPSANRPCFSCGREWGVGRSCQFCRAVAGLPAGVSIASPGKRLGGYVIEVLLGILTLGIGWVIWSLFVYGKGQTPAKQLLGMRVVDINTGSAASWGAMFLREVIIKILINVFTLGFAILWLLWDKDNQELWDKVLNVIVVNDTNNQITNSSTVKTVTFN